MNARIIESLNLFFLKIKEVTQLFLCKGLKKLSHFQALKRIVSAITQPKVGEGSSSSFGSSSSTAAAKDISHLVKKKRKLDEIIEEKDQEGNPAKKPSI